MCSTAVKYGYFWSVGAPVTQPLTPNLCSEIRIWALYACLKSTIQRWRSVHFFHLPPVEIADFQSLFRGNRCCEKSEVFDCTGSKSQLRTVSKSLFKSAKLLNIHIINESSKNLSSFPTNEKPPCDAHNQREWPQLLPLWLWYVPGSIFVPIWNWWETIVFQVKCCCSPEAYPLSCFPPVGLSCCTPPSDCLSSATAS